jgi:hypothetical protein
MLAFIYWTQCCFGSKLCSLFLTWNEWGLQVTACQMFYQSNKRLKVWLETKFIIFSGSKNSMHCCAKCYVSGWWWWKAGNSVEQIFIQTTCQIIGGTETTFHWWVWAVNHSKWQMPFWKYFKYSESILEETGNQPLCRIHKINGAHVHFLSKIFRATSESIYTVYWIWDVMCYNPCFESSTQNY